MAQDEYITLDVLSIFFYDVYFKAAVFLSLVSWDVFLFAYLFIVHGVVHVFCSQRRGLYLESIGHVHRDNENTTDMPAVKHYAHLVSLK